MPLHILTQSKSHKLYFVWRHFKSHSSVSFLYHTPLIRFCISSVLRLHRLQPAASIALYELRRVLRLLAVRHNKYKSGLTVLLHFLSSIRRHSRHRFICLCFLHITLHSYRTPLISYSPHSLLIHAFPVWMFAANQISFFYVCFQTSQVVFCCILCMYVADRYRYFNSLSFKSNSFFNYIRFYNCEGCLSHKI